MPFTPFLCTLLGSLITILLLLAAVRHGVRQISVTSAYREVSRQLEQDIPIWENKIHHDRPLLCDGDGPIGIFRRWCKQFYAENEESKDTAAA